MQLNESAPTAQLLVIVAVLTIGSISLAAYRTSVYHVPLVPHDRAPVWTVGAEIRFAVRPEVLQKPAHGVKVSFTLPSGTHAGVVILEEESIAPGYGLHRSETGGVRRAVWTRRTPDRRQQRLYYHLLVAHAQPAVPLLANEQPAIAPPVFDRQEQLAAETLYRRARDRSADRESLVQQLLQQLSNNAEPAGAGVLLRKRTPAQATAEVLRSHDIPARVALLLPLEGDPPHRTLQEALDVVVDNHWRLFDADTGAMGIPAASIIWKRGAESLIDVHGGENAHVSFGVVKHYQPSSVVSSMAAMKGNSSNLAFSLYDLPQHEQGLFKRLLIIPVAAMVIVVLREVVGIVTSGTFLPVLLALAFLDTTLTAGLIMFTIIVGTGVIVRTYASHLNLLLVGRIAAALVVVVFLMMALSIASWRLGIPSGLKVSVFPLVIIAWTIERLAITLEEGGAIDACKEVAGTLVASVLAYCVMSNIYLQHLVFNFPEGNLIILSLILLLGSYSGYRLTELRRFRHFRRVREHDA